MAALGISVIDAAAGLEADDTIAALTAGASSECGCTIVTSDKDFYQLLNPQVRVLNMSVPFHSATLMVLQKCFRHGGQRRTVVLEGVWIPT